MKSLLPTLCQVLLKRAKEMSACLLTPLLLPEVGGQGLAETQARSPEPTRTTSVHFGT